MFVRMDMIAKLNPATIIPMPMAAAATTTTTIGDSTIGDIAAAEAEATLTAWHRMSTAR